MKKLMSLLNRLLYAIKRKGFFIFLAQLAQFFLAVPTSMMIILIYPFFKIRLIKLYTSRIGQYGSNTHLMLCALISNDFPEEKKCLHLYYSYDDVPISNVFFHKMWKRAIPIVPFGALSSCVDRILILVFKKKYKTPFKSMFESSLGGHDHWDYFLKYDKKQFINFSKKEKNKGEELLNKIGIPSGMPFVCLLVRDEKYLKTRMPNSDDWQYNRYRDASIENYIPAIEFLTRSGFYVVRMGKEVGSALNLNNTKFIDYANHNLRSDFMDVFLSANCYFFVSTSCGIDCIPQIFYRPLITTNSIICDTRSYENWFFTIPKNVICKKTNKLVSYKEIYCDYQHFFLSGKYAGQDSRRIMFSEWKKKGFEFIENTPDEILGVVKEMVAFMNNSFVQTLEMKEKQRLFWRNFPAPLALNKSSYENIKMKISPSFLKKHANLMTEKSTCEID
ncbi:MAG: TIGR04372 family glycosyltransferase [Coxiellaceae bacterium]|nr:TIGR04372 family glycosyltransferase [Coxiellaceae bacterium]